MMHFSFHHTCVRVFDLEKSIKFYEDALGFKEARRSGVENDYINVFMEDKAKTFFIELCYNYNPETPYTHGTGYSHICVKTDDLQSAHKFHIESGFEPTQIYSNALYFITDPDGYRVEVIA